MRLPFSCLVSGILGVLALLASVAVAYASPATRPNDSTSPETPEPTLNTPTPTSTPVMDPEIQRQRVQQRINSERLQEPAGSTVRSTLDRLRDQNSSNRGEPAPAGTGTVLQY